MTEERDLAMTPREVARELRRNTKMTERIYNALFVGDPETKTPSLFTRVTLLEQAEDGKGIDRAMVAIGTLIGSAIGAVAAVYAFVTGGHK